MRYSRLTVFSMLLALSLLVVQGPAAAQQYSGVTRQVEGSFASHFHNRAQEERNKAVVRRVYDEIFGQGQTDLVNDLFAEIYIQHNPTLPNGRQGLIDFVRFLKSLDPVPVITVKHILADGDLVAVHWHASATPGNEFTGQAGFDLFRLDGSRIVEHWDVIQDVPPQTASGNSMFSDLYQYPGKAPKLAELREELNRLLVLVAYDGLFNDHQLQLLDLFFAGENYIQHNPLVPNGAAALAAILDVIVPEGSVLDFRHAVADGDLVFVHSQGLPPGADPNNEFAGIAVADIFRVVNGRIVEHWDAIQPVPAQTASGNSMFNDLYRRDQHAQ
jgi:predicted SnoaL-like aldol condensation-catalyzing enzyme